MSKTSPKRVIAMPTEAENRKIRRSAKADPDALPITDNQLNAMVPLSSVRLKVEQIQLVSEGLWVNLGSIRLQGA